jgi:hypothetical protein
MRCITLLALFALPLAGCPEKVNEALPPPGLAGVSGHQAPPQHAGMPASGPAAGLAAKSPHGPMGAPASQPAAAATSQPAGATVVKGEGGGEVAELEGAVREVHHVKEYSYMLVQAAGGLESWTAVLKDETIQVGTKVRVQKDLWMSDFDSPSLGRKFDRILFGRVESKS